MIMVATCVCHVWSAPGCAHARHTHTHTHGYVSSGVRAAPAGRAAPPAPPVNGCPRKPRSSCAYRRLSIYRAATLGGRPENRPRVSCSTDWLAGGGCDVQRAWQASNAELYYSPARHIFFLALGWEPISNLGCAPAPSALPCAQGTPGRRGDFDRLHMLICVAISGRKR